MVVVGITASRKSISMESISGNNLIDVQSSTSNNVNNNAPFVVVKQPINNQIKTNPVPSTHTSYNKLNNTANYNKFGTISGYNSSNISTNPHHRAGILTKSNTNYFNVNPSTNINDSSVSNSFGNKMAKNVSANAIESQAPTSLNGVVGSSAAAMTSDAQTLANNRLRAINRSFRTAVDKSFDMPCHSGNKMFTYCFLLPLNFCLKAFLSIYLLLFLHISF